MKLALRPTAPVNAHVWQRLACWAIRTRLVSRYCHGGIVIDGRLFHTNATSNLHVLEPHEWEPSRWDLVEVGGDDQQALRRFALYKGALYDWLSLLAFVGLRVSDTNRLYCFEWCWLAITGKVPDFRVTPELLLLHSVKPVPSTLP